MTSIEAIRRRLGGEKRRVVVGTGIVLMALIMPLFVQDFGLFLLTSILILGLYGAAYDLVYGYTGLLSFAHAIFFGVGGYGASIAIREMGFGVFPAMAIGILVAGVFAAAVGWFVVRIPSLTGFIVVTLILGTLIHLISITWNGLTGGTDGFIVEVPDVGVQAIAEYSFFDLVFAYYFILTFTVISIIILYQIVNSPTGLVFKMIRGNEERAKMLGYNTNVYKLVSFVISGIFVGLAGVLNILLNGYTSSANFGITTATDPILVTIIGGRGTLFGAYIGAGFVEIAQDQISAYSNSWPLFIGLLLIITVLVDEEGLINIARRVRGSNRSGVWKVLLPSSISNSNETNANDSDR